MKDREKQIEEMANCDKCVCKPVCMKTADINEKQILSWNEYVKQYGCQYYQPKLPEDSVVLSREEYERLLKTAQGKIGNMKSTDFLKACISSGVMVEAVSTEEQVKQAYEKVCKETAEKFLQLAYDRCLEKSFIKKVEELAKQFDVEIEEL